MGTDESVNLCVIRTGKCRTPIRKFKADGASGRGIMRFEPISVNQAPACDHSTVLRQTSPRVLI